MSDENATAKGRINDLEYVEKLSKSDQEKRNNEKMRKWGAGEEGKKPLVSWIPSSRNPPVHLIRFVGENKKKRRENFRKTSKIDK